jgi:2-iminobutanoate/2-iminopropanoate deaminase
MNRAVSPDSIAPPAANYALGIVTTGAEVMLHTAGVVAIRPDGTVPDTVAEQAEVVWTNLLAILGDAGMVPTDVVAITTYVVAGEELAGVMAARDRALDGHRAASTLITVPALVRPEWLVEVALIAAK